MMRSDADKAVEIDGDSEVDSPRCCVCPSKRTVHTGEEVGSPYEILSEYFEYADRLTGSMPACRTRNQTTKRMIPSLTNLRLSALCLAPILASCSGSAPNINAIDDSKVEEAGTVVWTFGKGHSSPPENFFTSKSGEWLPAKKESSHGVTRLARIKPYSTNEYLDNNSVDLPLENAKALLDYISWAKKQKLEGKLTESSNLIFYPLPGTNYWLRRMLPSGEWSDGTPGYRWGDSSILTIDIEDYESNLRKAVEVAEKL